MTENKEQTQENPRMFVDTTACIMVIENYIPKEDCDSIIKMGDDYLHLSNSKVDKYFDDNVKVDNTSFRQDTQLFVPYGFTPHTPFDLFGYAQDMCYYATHRYGQVIHSAVEAKPICRQFKWQRTEPYTKGFSNFHIEQSHGNMADRFLVWMLYLNDVEQGGTTEFLYQGVQIKPKAGTFVMWPAGVTHPHRGNPPYSNVKYIITGWMSAPNRIELMQLTHIYNAMENNDFGFMRHFVPPEEM